jgi:carboxypeptidase T
MQNSFSRKLVLVLSAFVFLAAVPLSSNQAAIPASRYRFFVQAPTRADLRKYTGWLNRNEFDIAGVNLQTGQIEVLTSEKGVQLLQSKGFKGRLVNVLIAGGRETRLSGMDARYLDPDRVAARMNQLHAKYPDVTRVVEFGRSLNNLPLLALVISTTPDINDPHFGDKPTAIFDGLHHAREIMTPEIVFDIGESILASAGNNARAHLALTGMNVVLVPMINVDGSTRVWNSDNMWRKNARSQGSTVFGVDINRNYPYRWANCGGSSNSKGAQDYHGTAAASEPETQALINFAEKIHPMASLSYHSYGELALYPFGCDGDLTGENALLEKLGKEMAGMLPADSGHGTYTPGTPWQILYAVDGDSMDYFFGAFGATAFTFEVNQDFQPNYSLREPTLQKHRAAWQYFLNQIQTRLATIAVRDAAGRPVLASLTIAEIPHTRGERDFPTNSAGNYFKVLLPGTYTIRAKTANGLTGSATLTMGESPARVLLTVQ